MPLGRLLGSSFTLASGSIKLSQSSLCLIHQFALLHVGFVGFVMGLKVSSFLDCIESRSHVYEKSFVCPGVPDRNLKFRTFADLGLETLSLEGRHRLLNGVFLRDRELEGICVR